MIPERDIRRAAILMLRRYGDKALEETATRADQLDTEGDPDGAATWRWIARAIEQLANTKPPGPVRVRPPAAFALLFTAIDFFGCVNRLTADRIASAYKPSIPTSLVFVVLAGGRNEP